MHHALSKKQIAKVLSANIGWGGLHTAKRHKTLPMKRNTQNSSPTISRVFARNMRDLIADRHTITSLSRDLGIHRNQLQRFVDGTSIPKPEILLSICQFFNVDARILTHPLSDLRKTGVSVLPDFLIDACDPVPRELFPDGFYEEWRELSDCTKPFVCHVLHVKTVDDMRHTKLIMKNTVIASDGTPKEFEGPLTIRGVAVRQAGGLCIIDRPDHNTSLTFTALRFGSYGDPDLYAGHKRSVRSVMGSGLFRKSATVIRRLRGGYREAMYLRRQPRYRTAEETPELIQWLLKEQQATVGYG